MDNTQKSQSKLHRIVVLSTLDEERVYIDGRMVAKGETLQAETVANLAEDNGIFMGEFFVIVVGITTDYELGDELSIEDCSQFGLEYDY